MTFAKDQYYTSNLFRNNKNRREGGAQIGISFYRGKQVGAYNCYKLLRKKYPKAAQMILDHYWMNKDGNIVISLNTKKRGE